MKHIEEYIPLTDVIKKLNFFFKSKEIQLSSVYITSMLKVKPSMFESLLTTAPLIVIAERSVSFSHLRESRIVNVFPIESAYIFLFLNHIYGTSDTQSSNEVQPFKNLLKKEISIHIHDIESNEIMKESYLLRLLTSIHIFGNQLKMDMYAIEKLYDIDRTKVVGTKISLVGTFFEKQKTKYFKPKYNLNRGTCLSIEELKTKRKNYLKAANDEIIVVSCPTCGKKHKRSFSNIKSLFSFSNETVTLACSHSGTMHTYESKPYVFKINKELPHKYRKIELIMYIINNKDYYGLQTK